MSLMSRFAYGIYATMAAAIGGIIYHEVFVEHLLDFAPEEGPFAAPVSQIELVAPLAILGMLLAVWVWVIIGGVQEERRREVERVRRP